MDPLLIARAIALGFTIAAAVGPISLLTIRRTLAHGRAYGLASGVGVALADATYAGIAAFALTAVTTVLVGGRTVLGVGGGAVVVWLGIRTLGSRPTTDAAGDGQGTGEQHPGLVAAAASIYALTMTNPMTILSFAALFGALGLVGGEGSGGVADPWQAATATVGVFIGSSLWWLVLTGAVAWLRTRVTLRGATWINRASGAVLLVLGICAIVASLAPT